EPPSATPPPADAKSPQASGQNASTTAQTKKPKFAFVTNSASTFWTIAEAGVQKAAQEFDVDAEMKIPAGGAIDEQQRIIEELIARKMDGMAISPIDPDHMTAVL